MSEGLRATGQTRRLALFGIKGVVSRCRNFSREALADWHWTPAVDEEHQAVVDDVLLLVSEVVTNACQHAGGPTELVLNCTDERLRIEVTDGSPEHPRPRPPGELALPGGHGLIVFDRLSRSWGTTPRGDGKTVWLEVPSPLRGARHRGQQALR
ncbi:ATP-binding protein [Streptomyces sp. NBC_01142]|uniref:ATP-binding protein n=1 Tax=Streptomyces sp. NBC_01142 TaxID=2975865 RepID=UPI002259262C|nr:ATP-binding protein [Streptomyces sp. NBC_01142]MCX4825489.1 ATP-binding protein [Streptomyces sp. NBC_01142]